MFSKNIIVFYILYTSFIFTTVCKGYANENISYGLSFRGSEVIQDERTSLILTPGKTFNLSPSFSMEFELKYYVDYAYGYVFRIISNDAVSLDLTTNHTAGKLYFVLAETNSTPQNIEFDKKELVNWDRWLKINISVGPDEITCSVDGISRKIPYSFKSLKNVDIRFGKNNHPKFYSTDVPGITVKNLILRNSKGKVVREYPLFTHNKTVVYDETGRHKAVVEHGIWEVDEYLKWKKLKTFVVEDINPQIAQDALNGRLFIASIDSLYIFNLENNDLKSRKTNRGRPFMAGGSQLFYDFNTDKLYSYSILYRNLKTYSFETNEWSNDLREEFPPIQQHNRYFDAKNNKLVIFGGYGMHEYRNELVIYDLQNKQSYADSISCCVSPRYLSSMGASGDGKFLVMGGYGSVSGKQEEFPTNFYDLYEVDYANRTCKKLADFPVEKNPRAFGNTLLVNSKKNSAYTLAFNNEKHNSYIYLIKTDLSSYEQTILADSIPYNFLDVESYCDLTYFRKTEKLYAIVLHKVEKQYAIEIYSLNFPPLTVTDVIQEVNTGNSLPFIACALSGALLIVFFVWKFRKRSQLKEFDQEENNEPHLSDEKVKKEKHLKSAVSLLGGFQTFDNAGNDITNSFTPTLKNLFLFLLLNSIQNDKKVSSQKIDDIFWEGADNAMNARSVNMRRLRLLLKEIGDIEIVNNNGYWSINIGESVTCDYEQVIMLLNKAQKNNEIEIPVLSRILKIASAGKLLPNTFTEWIDDFKSGYSGALIDLLVKSLAQPEVKKDLKLLLQIADLLLLHDSINEEAIQIKCKALSLLGQKGLSKQAYDRYYTSYLNILNSPTELKYEDLLRKNIQ